MEKTNERVMSNKKIIESLDRIEKLILLRAKNVYTVAEVAYYFGVTVGFIERLTCKKQIPYYKRGRMKYFDRKEIEDWAKAIKVPVMQTTTICVPNSKDE
ncbi:MAG: helix-turn-helix domain-containing protein [Bacteroidales bacterium]|nr:helix-turn-helix domain-containing protein [Bacteroidales bacterium]